MMMKAGATARAVIVFVLLGFCAARVECQTDRDSWTVTVVASTMSGTRAREHTIWVGFKNNSKGARLTCVTSSFGYLVQTEGVSPSSAAKALTDDCQVDERFHLVLPSETLYYPFVLESTAWRDNSSLQIELLVIAREKGSRGDLRTPLTWTGRLGDAVVAAKALGF
jgi:hypothetical protein